MSNGGCTHILKVVEDEMIFVAYDTHLYLIYYLSLSHFFGSTVGWVRMLEMLYY